MRREIDGIIGNPNKVEVSSHIDHVEKVTTLERYQGSQPTGFWKRFTADSDYSWLAESSWSGRDGCSRLQDSTKLNAFQRTWSKVNTFIVQVNQRVVLDMQLYVGCCATAKSQETISYSPGPILKCTREHGLGSLKTSSIKCSDFCQSKGNSRMRTTYERALDRCIRLLRQSQKTHCATRILLTI